MNLIRFVGLEEIEVLLKDGKVLPIKPKRDCIYFFPKECEGHSIPYRLEYISGIVSDYFVPNRIDGHQWLFICLNIDLAKKALEESYKTYADPEGSFFDTILVQEYHRKEGYSKDDVESVDIWGYDNPWGVGDLIQHFESLEEAREWMKQKVGKTNE